MAAGFSELLMTLEQQDFFIGVLPFLLTYIVFYMSLQQVPLFDGEDQGDRMAALVSIIAGFFVSFFLVNNPAYQTFFVDYLGTVTVGLIGLLGLLVLMALTGTTDYFKKNIFGLAALVIVVGAFSMAGGPRIFGLTGQNLGFIGEWINTAFDTGLIWVAVVLGAVWYITGEEDESDTTIWDALFKHGPGDDP